MTDSVAGLGSSGDHQDLEDNVSVGSELNDCIRASLERYLRWIILDTNDVFHVQLDTIRDWTIKYTEQKGQCTVEAKDSNLHDVGVHAIVGVRSS